MRAIASALAFVAVLWAARAGCIVIDFAAVSPDAGGLDMVAAFYSFRPLIDPPLFLLAIAIAIGLFLDLSDKPKP